MGEPSTLDRARSALAAIRGFVGYCEETDELDLPPQDRERLEQLTAGLEVLVEERADAGGAGVVPPMRLRMAVGP